MNELLKKHNLTMKQVSQELNIPYRTVQNWHLGTATPPDYILNLIDLYYIHKTILTSLLEIDLRGDDV